MVPPVVLLDFSLGLGGGDDGQEGLGCLII